VLTIGLTGGISTGKSSVSALLDIDEDIVVVDADKISRAVCSYGSVGLSAVIERFGTDFLTPDGTLDRAKMRALIMRDSAARRDLEGILHPLIRETIAQLEEEARQGKAHVFVVEAALMIEAGTHKDYDSVVVVTCKAETQLERLMVREGIDAESARRWISTQLPLNEKVKYADYTIHNDGDMDDLKSSVTLLLNEILPNR